jgi:hypothetical protein
LVLAALAHLRVLAREHDIDKLLDVTLMQSFFRVFHRLAARGGEEIFEPIPCVG